MARDGATATGQRPVGGDVTVTLVTVIMVVVVGLTFAFGFGNVFQLGLRLGVPVWVAPLVAPAVDLSVVGLLLGTRQLAVQGAPVELLRPARRLLVFSSLVTLALNVAEPVIAGEYGKAAFDAVGPALLFGWSEVGPGLLRAMRHPGPLPAAMAESDRRPVEVGTPAQAAVVPAVPPVRVVREAAPVAAVPAQRAPDGSGPLVDGGLLERARREDARYWEEHRRPISSDELRRRLKVGSKRARALVKELRADAHRVFGEHAASDPPSIATASFPPPAHSQPADGDAAEIVSDDLDLVDLGPVERATSGLLATVG
ncbi:hypothetical protein [Pseudofrankia inefficax]|uniref:DUF2637 domain-containing protein n=1 Tax=Pseudofrankia inefficax (strain DSM 45817 / CECT 9037 / DDB 130130 / EuI1c) TaxID=298654 RepID=E3IW92_PSEI1|nr:hypothetical protein [Pseudofrankia inefficax]ADP78934.1 hypothetical protein FraEuI1c_0856 [Pseudofrankia inefficax]